MGSQIQVSVFMQDAVFRYKDLHNQSLFFDNRGELRSLFPFISFCLQPVFLKPKSSIQKPKCSRRGTLTVMDC